MDHTSTSDSVPTTRAIFTLAWPLNMKAIMLHGIVVIDAYLVAALGEEAIAALGLAGSIAGLILGILGAFSNATQIRVAQAFGTGQAIALKSAFFCGLTINVLIAIFGAVFVLALGGTIIDTFAHTSEIAVDAQRYLNVFMVVIVAEAIALCLTSHFNGCGETKLPFYSYLITVPANVGFSVILIHGLYGAPELGVVGAAAGSAIGAVIRAVFLAYMFHKTNRNLLSANGWLRGTFWPTFRRHLMFALPIAATFISAVLGNSVCTLIYATLSVNQFAAMTLIMPWVMVAGTFGMSWAQATGIFVAQLLGRNLPDRDLDAFLSGAWRAAFVAAAVVSAFYASICLLSSRLYPDLHPDTTATLLSFLPVLLLLPFPKGSNAICGNTLRAGGDTIYVMHIFVWSQWLFRVPVTALMVLYLDLSVTWVFSLLLFEELIKFPAFHIRLFKGAWKNGAISE